MNPSNKAIQQRKTCELYAYVLRCQGHEVPEAVQACADAYDDPIDCMTMLAQALERLDRDTFDQMLNNTSAPEAQDLAHWWNMHQEAQRLYHSMVSDLNTSES